MSHPLSARNALLMSHASARHQLVGALADRMRNRPPEAAYAAAISQIEALHTSPAITARQARVGTLMVLDALAEALAEE
jgi:hypothetical protein